MENYYVLYDIDDNLICYLDTIDDLIRFTGLRKYDITYKFKKSSNDYIQVNVDQKRLNVYRFI